MFRRVLMVKPAAWLLLGIALLIAIVPRLLLQVQVIDAHTALYYVQPVLALAGAAMGHYMLRGQHDRLRHKGDKALLVGSVLSVWFVAYFLSGLATTFVHNAVASSFQAIVMNLLLFGATVFGIEYIRYSLMLLAGRRSFMWFGFLVSLVLALQQVALLQFSGNGSVENLIKFVIGSVMPSVIGSLLCTYLAVSAGLGPQLTYAFGSVAAAVLPPIIPKYDWYMSSMASILLAVAVYIVVDRSQGDDDRDEMRRHRHPRIAFDIAFGCVMVALVLFMTGIFTYKPVVIMSNSMVPVFERGSIVIVQVVHNPMDIRLGDIIQYQAENKTVTHRVVAIETAEDDSGDLVFTTKGDNNPSRDAPVKQQQVIGVIRSTVPYIGLATVWLHDVSQGH